MKSQTLIWTVIIVLIVAGGGWWLLSSPATTTTDTGTDTGTQTPAGPSDVVSMTTPQGVSFSYGTTTWGFAVTPEQVLVTSYIPPCDQKFGYCLYRIGDTYKGTNFESAGLRVNARTDLTTERLCLYTPPSGFSATTQPTATTSAATYSTSVFGNVGDAGAGHYAAGSLYRLFVKANNSCTEFETRIGETQYANYPAGTIQLFTDANRASVMTELQNILKTVTVASSGTKVVFPSAIPVSNTGTAAIGGNVTINGTTIGVLSLVEDSRCPADVNCIQAGTVRVRTSINSMNGDFTFQLGAPQIVVDKTITLTAVVPAQRLSKVTIKPSDYRFTFSVQ